MSTSASRRVKRGMFALFASGALVLTSLASNASAAQQQPLWARTTPCPHELLCVWDGPYGQGNRVDYYYCEPFQDVRDDGLERVGSFINNQTDGTVATFYGPNQENPNIWFEQYSSTAFEFRDDDSGFETYGIQVC